MANPETIIFSWPRLNRNDDVVVWAARLVDRIASSGVGSGAQGPVGPAGPPGPTGPTGPAGADGSQILAGSGPPTTGVGVDGDYYIDTNTGTLYGPKSSIGYGTAEGIIAGTPGTVGAAAFRLGNTYQATIAGQIVGARFWRDAAHFPAGEISHTVEVYDHTHALIATSAASTENPAFTGWVQLTFATPILLLAGDQFTTVVDLNAYPYSTSDFSVINTAHATYVTGVYGTYGSAAWPGYSGAYNFFCDAVWQPQSGTVWPVALQGEQGPDAYRYVQASAATTWAITHNLGFRPNVAVVDSTGREIVPGAVDYTSDAAVTLTFSAAVGGEAYLS